jgi:N-acetyl-1-D-myo-inositol-2-amino-2-deoxy-alpha-D-glucopyranoside deacetylase
VAPITAARRLLLVHAHPDDETIGTGATMARYVAEGAHVTLVTCTLGEEGEILVPELAHLAADREDALGRHRIGERKAAMAELGVTDYRWLGGPGRWRDSGMMDTPANEHPDSFFHADLDEATAELVRVVREVRPQVIVTYPEDGGYGHPDHIRAHDVAAAAFRAAGDARRFPDAGAAWRPAKLYYSAIPKSHLQQGIDALAERGESLFDGVTSVDDLPFGVPDEAITTEIDGRAFLDAKIAAMRCYPTQIAVDGPFFALTNNVGRQTFGLESYVLAEGARGAGHGEHGAEADLFAGLDGASGSA